MHPNHPDASREILLAKNYLRVNDNSSKYSYHEFKKEFEMRIQNANDEDTAFLWDRIGHWAQDEDEWEEAATHFRKAYEIEGGEYGYCLGVALNQLGQFKESLPILVEQAEKFNLMISAGSRSQFHMNFKDISKRQSILMKNAYH